MGRGVSPFVPSLRFEIPLGGLVPVRVENLVPACKNIGTTHITNGCYRLHPVEWNIGEAVGHLLALAHAEQAGPRVIRAPPRLPAGLQQRLVSSGVETAWP